MAGLIVEIRDQAKAAAIAFVGVFIKSLGGSAHCRGLEFSRAPVFEAHVAAGCRHQCQDQLERQFVLRSGSPARINAAGFKQSKSPGYEAVSSELRSPVYTVTLYEPDNTGLRGAFKRCFAPPKSHWAYGKTIRAWFRELVGK